MVSSRPMMILPISRAWMYSRAARCVDLVCSVLALALSGTLAGTRAAQAAFGSQTLPPATAVVLRLVLIPEVIGSALLWVAMLYSWFNCDPSSWLRRALWFPFVFCFIPLALALYHFLVYRRWTRGDRQTSSVTASVTQLECSCESRRHHSRHRYSTRTRRHRCSSPSRSRSAGNSRTYASPKP